MTYFGQIQTNTVFTQCSNCGVEPQMRGQTPPFAPQCKRKSPAPIAGSEPPFVLLQIWRVRPRMQGLTPLFCVCVFTNRKLGLHAPAMYRTFPCVEREISYLSSFNLPRLRGLLLEWDHCVNVGQWTPPPPQDGSDPPPGFDPGIGALCKGVKR